MEQDFSFVFDAMQKYSKDGAIDFAEWRELNSDEYKTYHYTTDQLYEIYKGQTPSPTGDRDCEELKERISELENCLKEFVANVQHSIIESGIEMDLPYITKAKQLLNL